MAEKKYRLAEIHVWQRYLVMYLYVESGDEESCGFICTADSFRMAAEKFWNQHPGREFRILNISTKDGTTTYWNPDTREFYPVYK